MTNYFVKIIFKGDRMKKKEHFHVGKLKCNGCGNYHYQWWMISHQKRLSRKIGCASYTLYKEGEKHYEIICDYGSGYDTSSFKVTDRIFSEKSISILRLIQLAGKKHKALVCDKCIERFIRRGYISLIKSEFI